MIRKEFTFPSADGKTAIHTVEWLPLQDPRAVLQIAHGMTEYILRYEPFAEYLTDRGFAVVGHDHLGHGESISPDGTKLYFGTTGSWNWVTKDIYTLRQTAAKHFPGIPHFLLGHSMGSFLVRTYLIQYPGTVNAAILMGTGQLSPLHIASGKAIVALESQKIDENQPSPLAEHLSFTSYNKLFAPNRTGYDWLSASTKNVDDFIADPWCGGQPTIGLFREMLNGISYISKPEHLKKMNPQTPILFLSGSMDPVGNCGKGVQQAYRSFLKAGIRNVSIRLYPQLRHEILYEDCREQIYQDIFDWMEEKLPIHVS